MRRLLCTALTVLAAGTALIAILAAAIPLWLVLRVPGVVASPGSETG
ncbi:MAG: hypothetical protein ACLFRX_10375 [Gemmatimonadota bacterium]